MKGGEDALQASSVDPAKGALNPKIAAALLKANPQLKRVMADFNPNARAKNIPLDEGRSVLPALEINSLEGNNGIQIELYEDEICISAPYWHARRKARATFQEIWEYLQVIQRESGFVIYDSQLDKILDLSQGYQESLSMYLSTRQAVSGQMSGVLISRTGKPRKKRWQFWK